MPDPQDPRRQSLGMVAVQLGLINQAQLMDCIRAQSGEFSDLSIDQILVEKKHLTQDQVDKLLLELSRQAAVPGPSPSPDRPTRATSVRPGTASRNAATGVTAARPAEPPPPPSSGTGVTKVRQASTGQVEAAPPSPPQGGTKVRRAPTGEVAVPAGTPERLTGRRERTTAKRVAPEKPPAPAPRRSTAFVWIVTGLLAIIPVAALSIIFVLRNSHPPAPPIVVKTPPPAPTAKPTALPLPPKKPVADEGRIRARLTMLKGDEPFIAKWNEIAHRIDNAREPEQYKSFLPDLERIVTEARGTKYEDLVVVGYREVLEAMKARAEQVFAFLSDEVARLCAAGKYGEAVKSWDWFPLHLDTAGLYAKRIDEKRAETVAAAETEYGKSKEQVDELLAKGRISEAKLLLLRALEIGFPKLVDDAYQRLSKLTEIEDAAARKAEEAQLAEFEKLKKAERESAGLVAAYRKQFWDLVTARNLDGASTFLGKEKQGAAPELAKELDSLAKTLAGIRSAFEAAGERLKGRSGQSITLAILENGRPQSRSFHLVGVSGGRIRTQVEGRDFTLPLEDLDVPELLRLAEGAGGETGSLIAGLGRMLSGDFPAAHADLKAAGAQASALAAFIEGSTGFLEKNAGPMKEAAAKLMAAKDWAAAADAWSRLAAIPSERKAALRGRARAYYQQNNFVSTVLDIESLFEMDDFSEEVIELLNQSYKRATLIAKAIQIYEAASRRVPSNPTVLANLVALYMQIHEYQKAQEALGRAEKVKGFSGELAQLAALLHTCLEPSFAGQTFKAKFGRYDLETNVSQKYANDMAQFMDKVYQSYVKVFPYKKNETLRFHVKLFASESEFFGYFRKTTGSSPVGDKGKVLAYYMPLTKELVGWNAEDILETLMHEGLHQYIDYFVTDCPIWFNEGYASYFEKSTADEAIFNPGRHMTVRYMLSSKQLPSMKEIFMMDRATFRKEGALHYGSSWSVIYWMHRSGNRHILDRYFEALMAGKDQQQAFDEVFGPGKANVEALDAKWRRSIFTENYDE